MQRHPRYRDVVHDVETFLVEATQQAQEAGIKRSRILWDVGLGFGKTTAHNLALLQAMTQFIAHGYPVVLGPSRKSFIGKTLGSEHVEDRLPGTLACVAWAQECGVQVVRVHDVRPAVQVIQMLEAIQKGRAR